MKDEILFLRNKLHALIELRNFYIAKQEFENLVNAERAIADINIEIDKASGVG